ncbi:MAG: carboxyltransferase domain-containing protein, partial [Rhodospirillaceae bacterium]
MTPVPFDSVRFLPCGDTGLCVEFGSIIDRPTSARVVALGKALDHAALPGVQETVPTYRSLMVHYDPLQTTAETLESQIRTLLKRDGETTPGREGTSWRLPVCFDGPDLEAVASWGNMTPEDLVAILTSTP